jgi:hypothetical protein
MPGAFPDILSSAGDAVRMRNMLFTLALEQTNANAVPGLRAASGFLDDSWYFRTHWRLGRYGGQLLVFGLNRVYGARVGYGIRSRVKSRHHEHFDRYPDTDFPRGTLLFSATNARNPAAGSPAPDWAFPARGGPPVTYVWSADAPMQVRAMVLTGADAPAGDGVLFVAGWHDQPGLASPDSARSVLWALAADDPRQIAEIALEAAPAFDGLIAARGRLYLTTAAGTLECLAAATR